MLHRVVSSSSIRVAAVAGTTGWFLLQYHPVRSESISEPMSLYEDYKRAFSLWKGLGPIISHYRMVEFKQKIMPPASEEERSEEWQRLHEKYADLVLERFKDLRGFYIKVAQMMASRNDDLPPIYVERLRTLEDAVPPKLTGPEARDKICRELGLQRLEDVFTDFVDEPVGSASIGQVHKARLKGEPVAIKIKSPGAEVLFKTDVKRARQFCKVFAPEQVILFDEIERQFLTEFDYVQEASQLGRVADSMNSKFGDRVRVPRPYMDHCTRDILTMEFLKGPKLIDGVRQFARSYAERKGTTLEALEREARAKIQREGLPPPYSGPSAATIEWYRRGLRLRDALINIPIRVYNLCLFPVLNLLLPAYFSHSLSLQKSLIPLNTARLMETLLIVHGHQLFMDGFFNADPHPGNFLLLEEDDGDRIGLLDYGQVKRLNENERKMLAELFIALANEDPEAVFRVNQKSGYKSRHNNPDVIYRVSQIAFDQDGAQVTGGMNIQQYMDRLFAQDPWEETLDLFVMPSRMSLLLRGIGLMMNHPVSVAKAWKPIAQEFLDKINAH